MITPWVYWKSATVVLDVSAPAARRRLCQAMSDSGFSVPVAHAGREISFTRRASLPGLPHLQVWAATVEGQGNRTQVRIEFGLRATGATWLFLAAILVLMLLPIFIPGFELAAMIPILWLFAFVLLMQGRTTVQEARLWRAMGATILERSTSWRVVE